MHLFAHYLRLLQSLFPLLSLETTGVHSYSERACVGAALNLFNQLIFAFLKLSGVASACLRENTAPILAVSGQDRTALI